MEYNKIQDKYTKNGVPDFQFKNILQVKKIVGTDPTKAKYWDLLKPNEKALVDRFIVRYLSGMGLQAREGIVITKVYNCTHYRQTSINTEGELCSTGYVFFNNTINLPEEAKTWEQEDTYKNTYWDLVKINKQNTFLRVDLQAVQDGEIQKESWFHVYQDFEGQVEFY